MSQPPPPQYPPGGTPPWGGPPPGGPPSQYPPGGTPPSGGPPQYPPGGQPPGGVPPGGWGPGPGGYGGPPPGPPRRSQAPLIFVVVVAVAAIVGVGIVLLVQGGSDERSQEEQDYVDALAAVAGAEPDEGFSLTSRQNRCLAEALVDVLGVDALRDEATPEELQEQADEGNSDFSIDMDEDQAGAIYDQASGCVDFRQVILDSVREEADLSDEDFQCLSDRVTDDMVRDLLVASFTEDEDAVQRAGEALDDAAEPCRSAGA